MVKEDKENNKKDSIKNKLNKMRKERKEENKKSAKNEKKPFVSVIIPTYNQQELLMLTINALLSQTYLEKRYEIIVVDDGSSDYSKALIGDMAKNSPVEITYIFQEDKGFRAGQARNLGAKNAKGEMLIFIDADIIVFPDFIEKHVKNLEKKKGVVLGYSCSYGTEYNYNIWELKEKIQKKLDPSPMFMEEFRHELFLDPALQNSKSYNNLWQLFVSNNFSISRKLFSKFNFDEGFSGWGEEDIDLGYRLHKAGHVLYLCKDAVGMHINVTLGFHKRNYTQEKVDSLVANMKVLYKKHRNNEMKEYITKRFNNVPKCFTEGKHDVNNIFKD